jgi:hypothetical protein
MKLKTFVHQNATDLEKLVNGWILKEKVRVVSSHATSVLIPVPSNPTQILSLFVWYEPL